MFCNPTSKVITSRTYTQLLRQYVESPLILGYPLHPSSQLQERQLIAVSHIDNYVQLVTILAAGADGPHLLLWAQS